MNILIIGSEGFIGNHLVKHFMHQGWKVIGCDLRTPNETFDYEFIPATKEPVQWESLFSSYQIAYCINAAGAGNVSYSIEYPLYDFEANTLDVIRILDAIRNHQPDIKYLHISSAAVYGNPAYLPISEDAVLAPLSPYGWHKLMSEQICQEYRTIYQIPVAIIRPFSVYGPGLRKQLIWDLYQKIVKNKEVTLYGTGKESRDFIYIEDMMQAIERILLVSGFNGEVYNIASGTEITIYELANIFRSVIGNGCSINFNDVQRPGDPLNWRADIGKLNQLGFQPSFSIEKGLEATYQWLRQNG